MSKSTSETEVCEKPSKPLGKRARNALLIRNNIMAATTLLIQKKGIEGTTIAAIIRQADISLRTLYMYFDSKHAILMAVLEQEHANQKNVIEKALAGNPANVIDYIYAVLDSSMDVSAVSQNRHLWQEILAACIIVARDSKFIAELNRDKNHYKEYLQRALDRLIVTGGLRADAPTKLLVDVLYNVASQEFQSFACGEYDSVAQFEKQMRLMLGVVIGPWQAAN